MEALSTVQKDIAVAHLQIIDVEVERIRDRIAALGMGSPSDRHDLPILQGALATLANRLQAPGLQGFLEATGGDRHRQLKELGDALLGVELTWDRSAAQMELLGLRKELDALEREQGPGSPSAESVLHHRDRANANAKSQLTTSGVKQAAQLARITNPLFQGHAAAVRRIIEDTSLDMEYIPTLSYPVGMDDSPTTPLLAIDDDLARRGYQSQWFYISEFRRASSTAVAWHRATNLRTSAAPDDPIIGYAPKQSVALRGFFISTRPIRLSDYRRMMQTPEYAAKLEGLLTEELLDGHRWNSTPTFVHGHPFGFERHLKDAAEDADDPILELPFFKAKRFCEAVGGRLPTWQEWEAAMRGEEGWLYPWGDDLDLNALTFQKPVPWEIDLKPRATGSDHSALEVTHDSDPVRGQSTRLHSWGVYGFGKSPFGLRAAARWGFEWNTANGDLGPGRPATHLLRTMGDYYTQFIFEGGDEAKRGNHRSFSGPVLPLYAMPNRFTRAAAFRIVLAVPGPENEDLCPSPAGSTNVTQLQACRRLGQQTTDDSALRWRVDGCGGGVLPEPSARLGFSVGEPLPRGAMGFPSLWPLLGNESEKAIQLLGQPEEVSPHPTEHATHWSYYSLGIQLTLEAIGRRQVVSGLQLYDSTAEDWTLPEWDRFAGAIDRHGLPLKDLTLQSLEKSPGWGPPDWRGPVAAVYVRDFLDVLPPGDDVGSALWTARQQNAGASLCYEVLARPDGRVAWIKICHRR